MPICVSTCECDMTSSYFDKMNSTLGSVVPLAMFYTDTVCGVCDKYEVWSKLSNSWPVFFGSDSLWPRMSRAPFEDSKTSGQRLEKLKSNLARLNIKLIWVQIQFKRSEHRPNLWEERHARLRDWIAKRREMWEAGRRNIHLHFQRLRAMLHHVGPPAQEVAAI